MEKEFSAVSVGSNWGRIKQILLDTIYDTVNIQTAPRKPWATEAVIKTTEERKSTNQRIQKAEK